jgi:aspartyl-tRNA(Asn)/glutamyl-tRNA(Gln) amidotransferase subunit B
MVEAARAELPELPAARADRFASAFGLEVELAERLAFDGEIGDFFEAVVAERGTDADARLAATWVSGELTSRAGDDGLGSLAITTAQLAELLDLLESERITNAAARQVLDAVLTDGLNPGEVVQRDGLEKVGGGDELEAAVDAAIAAEPEAAAKVAAGEHKALGPLVGVVMKETQGRADGGEVRAMILSKLGAS